MKKVKQILFVVLAVCLSVPVIMGMQSMPKLPDTLEGVDAELHKAQLKLHAKAEDLMQLAAQGAPKAPQLFALAGDYSNFLEHYKEVTLSTAEGCRMYASQQQDPASMAYWLALATECDKIKNPVFCEQYMAVLQVAADLSFWAHRQQLLLAEGTRLQQLAQETAANSVPLTPASSDVPTAFSASSSVSGESAAEAPATLKAFAEVVKGSRQGVQSQQRAQRQQQLPLQKEKQVVKPQQSRPVPAQSAEEQKAAERAALAALQARSAEILRNTKTGRLVDPVALKAEVDAAKVAQETIEEVASSVAQSAQPEKKEKKNKPKQAKKKQKKDADSEDSDEKLLNKLVKEAASNPQPAAAPKTLTPKELAQQRKERLRELKRHEEFMALVNREMATISTPAGPSLPKHTGWTPPAITMQDFLSMVIETEQQARARYAKVLELVETAEKYQEKNTVILELAQNDLCNVLLWCNRQQERNSELETFNDEVIALNTRLFSMIQAAALRIIFE